MTREIKFRAEYQGKIHEVSAINWFDERVQLNETPAGSGIWVSISEVNLIQYTGLKDKNGKEIYEGDIILGDAVVVYRDKPDADRDYGCFGITNGKYPLSSYVDKYNFEVIGNIYENPELINN